MMCRVMLLLGLTLVLAGCGGGESKLPTTTVDGLVTLDGAPIPTGEIQFFPADGGHGPDSTTITDGVYSLPVTLGPKRVVILGYTPTGPVFDGKPGNEQVVPARYNEKSELTAEVTADTGDLPFELQSGR